MKAISTNHHRRSIRIPGYDYAQPGKYYITICTKNRAGLFGDVVDSKMILNDLGIIVTGEWMKTQQIRPNVKCETFVVMPNHVHGIIEITEYDDRCCRGVSQYAPTTTNDQIVSNNGRTLFQSPSKTIGAIIRGFKAAATKRINHLRQTPGESVWQRNYYEHIIRNENECSNICNYIKNNPVQWEKDSMHPILDQDINHGNLHQR